MAVLCGALPAGDIDTLLVPMSSEQVGVEAYAKADATAIIAVLSKLIGPLEATESSNNDPLVFGNESTSVVLWESEDGFVSVCVRGSAEWASSAVLGRFLAAELHCTVRCDPGAEFPDVSPYSNVFLEIEEDGERLVAWG
jgi:hypothetical protein